MSEHYTNAKIGRNAPCPCGSDKKYKRCCLVMQERCIFCKRPAHYRMYLRAGCFDSIASVCTEHKRRPPSPWRDSCAEYDGELLGEGVVVLDQEEFDNLSDAEFAELIAHASTVRIVCTF